ncbi:MAG: GNAT family N-acetyltransferase [Acidimicrobiales bacterium]|nr:GNAT family N-acetyltransferase [Acidimicrobiales bacterium]
MSSQYRLHRIRQGDEWALNTLAKGNARFGHADDRPWVPPLSSEEVNLFVSDPRTICLIAIHMDTNHMAGFAYGCVLYRRHTKLRHLCIYEVGVDIDHRDQDVGKILVEGLGAEARQMGIDQGFAFTSVGDRQTRAIYESAGAQGSNEGEVIYGFEF